MAVVPPTRSNVSVWLATAGGDVVEVGEVGEVGDVVGDVVGDDSWGACRVVGVVGGVGGVVETTVPEGLAGGTGHGRVARGRRLVRLDAELAT